MQFEQLGPYRLGKKLGQGGMGAVYEGADVDSHETAAIKVLSPALAVEEGFRVRFEAEIESLKKLRHPNIVRLYGYGEQAGTLFYSMELVPGTSLEDELRAGRRFEWREVTQIAIKLCRALKHAHDHGVIHRDLKPANLLLTTDGEIKLSDFGIARLFGNTRLTSDGGVLGTAEYMSPEQADGRAVTDRCDQYSLGGVLYALLAGRPPFRAKSLVEMLQLQRFAEPEPVTRFAPETPAELARIIHQLLEKEPQKRFSNTLILSRSLEAMERGLSAPMSQDDDFVLSKPDESNVALSGYSSLAPTLSPGELPPVERTRGSATPGEAQATAVTMAYADVEKPLDATATPRFTKVQETQVLHTSALGDVIRGLLAPQALGLIAGLLVLVAAGWYLAQPPSADALHRQIETGTADGEIKSLKDNLPGIESFLARFPDDPRSEALRGLAEEVKQSHPIQRAYIEAKRYALVNPELALAKFQALIDVYDDGQDDADASRQYVKLARQQVKDLNRRLDQYVADGRKLVQSRLARAAELSADNPESSRKIYRGIVELYADKPWASELVRQAQAALSAVPSAPPRSESADAR